MRLPCFAALLLLVPSVGFCQTGVGGSIATDTTWDLAGSPYQASSTVTVLTGVTLTIEPGVQIVFSAGRQLIVEGTLVARGTDPSPITFTSTLAIPGYWGGVRFTNTSVDAAFDAGGDYLSGSILEHCHVEYGGKEQTSQPCIELQNAAPALQHLLIDDADFTGIREIRTETAPPLRILDVVVRLSVGYGVDIDGGEDHLLEDVHVLGPVSGNFVSQPVGIRMTDATGVLLDDCRVDNLTNDANHTAILFNDVSGVVRDCYTEDSPKGCDFISGNVHVLRHKSVRDQGGIFLDGNGTNPGRVEDCDLINGGGVGVGDAPFAEIINNRISGSASSGIRVLLSDDVLIQGNRVTDGTGGGAFIQLSENVRMEGNQITNNNTTEGGLAGGVFVREADGLVLVGNDLSHNQASPPYPNLLHITALIGNPNQHYTVDLSGALDGSDYNTLLDTTDTGFSVVVTDSIEVLADRACWVFDPGWSRIDLQDDATMLLTPAYFDCMSLLDVPEEPARPIPPLAVWPNPTTGRASIAFTLAEPGPVQVVVYDIRGRLVASLVDGRYPAGRLEIDWDGRGAQGRDVASGIYLVRLRTAKETSTRRIVRIDP